MIRDAYIDIQVVHTGACSVFRVKGDIDLRSAPAFRVALLKLLERCGQERVIVDLGGTKHMDSSGLASLVEGWHEAKRRNERFILSGLNPGPRRVLDLTRLSQVFEITQTVEEALGLNGKCLPKP